MSTQGSENPDLHAVQTPKKRIRATLTAPEKRPKPRRTVALMESIGLKLLAEGGAQISASEMEARREVLGAFVEIMIPDPPISHYSLHPAFATWREWESIVLSMLKAWASDYARFGLPHAKEPTDESILENDLFFFAAPAGGFNREQWNEIFDLLHVTNYQPDGDFVPPEAARNFFNRAIRGMAPEGAHEKYDGENEAWIRKWVRVHAGPDEFPGLCALDNGSIARLLNWPDESPSAVRRKLRPYALMRCRLHTWTVPALKPGIKRTPSPVRLKAPKRLPSRE